jgi:hypothetical protein
MHRDPTNDTHPDIEAMRIEAYRRMTPTQKLEIVCELNKAVRELSLADIRRRHPHADERELMLRLASRTVDPDLLKRAFGWDVEVEGY